MPHQTHYCTIHGSDSASDCPECYPEIVEGAVEDAPGFRVSQSPNEPDPLQRSRPAGVTFVPPPETVLLITDEAPIPETAASTLDA
jgi:hypothetical protein